MKDEDKKAVEGLMFLLDDRPVNHECENCGDVGKARISQLPPGWAYLARVGSLARSLNEVDENSRILCSLCIAVVEAALKRVPKVPKTCPGPGKCSPGDPPAAGLCQNVTE